MPMKCNTFKKELKIYILLDHSLFSLYKFKHGLHHPNMEELQRIFLHENSYNIKIKLVVL